MSVESKSFDMREGQSKYSEEELLRGLTAWLPEKQADIVVISLDNRLEDWKTHRRLLSKPHEVVVYPDGTVFIIPHLKDTLFGLDRTTDSTRFTATKHTSLWSKVKNFFKLS